MAAKLLIFTPTYGDGPQPATLAAIAALTFDGELVHEISWHNPHFDRANDMRNVIAQYQRGRQMALDGGYDGLLCIEHDMIIPPHAAQTLWDDGAPVVYGVYTLRHESYVMNAWTKRGIRLGKPMSFYPDLMTSARQAGRVEVGGLGFGCTLIRRHVLEKIPMRNEGGNAPDTPFAKDCLRRGFMQIARFDVACQHIDNGITLEPFMDGGIACRIYALRDATLTLNGQPWALEKERYYTVAPPVAKVWARAGHVRITSGVSGAS